MTERIGELAVAIAPELIGKRKAHRRARRQRLFPDGVGIGHLEVEDDPAGGGEALPPISGKSSCSSSVPPLIARWACISRSPPFSGDRATSVAPNARA